MPTIKPNTDSTSTINPGTQNNPDIPPTLFPGRDKTVKPGEIGGDIGQTLKPDGDGTKTPDSPTTGGIDTVRYQPRRAYTIQGIHYTVIKPLSLTSGEAQVFLVQDPKGDKSVLKLYYRGAGPTPAILDKVKSANSANILFKELSHGIFEDRYYELLQYYDGDTLQNIDVRKSEADITPLIKSMACAIDLCHQLGFIHRDVKPSNFIFNDKKQSNLLLGDFGIAVQCDHNGQCIADMARTKTFAAPEVYLNTGDSRAKFSKKSDFYSLGIDSPRHAAKTPVPRQGTHRAQSRQTSRIRTSQRMAQRPKHICRTNHTRKHRRQ